MIRAMRTAATGMTAQQLNVDNIANNLANVNTTGFKKSRVEFQDLFYRQTRMPGVATSRSSGAPAHLEIGYGTAPVSTQRSFSQGELLSSGNPLDVAIKGEGFFRVMRPDGGFAYTRDGAFKITGEGRLMTTDGYMLDPEITIPEETTNIGIAPDGVVSVTLSGDNTPLAVGQIELVRFSNPAGLQAIGQNLFRETPASGESVLGIAANDGLGQLTQGYLELSNVNIVEEMIALITAQRAYEINSKSIKAAEEMMAQANNLAR